MLSAVESAVSVTQTFRAAFCTGWPDFGSVTAYAVVVKIEARDLGPAPVTAPRLSLDHGFAVLYDQQFDRLCRLALMLLSDRGAAEDVVQDSFAKVFDRRRRIENAPAYLRTTVQGIYSLIKRGRLRSMPGSGKLLFTREALDDCLKKRRR